MLHSAHTFANDPTWGWVPTLLDNKVAVGSYFAVEQAINYNSDEDSIVKTMQIAAAVSTSSVQAARNLLEIDNTFLPANTTSDIPRESRTVAFVVAADVLQAAGEAAPPRV